MDGMLNVHKEKGYTSHDVVAKLRGILHMKKIGHTGTLDPEAEGVLPVALGAATRLVDLFTEKEKTYEALLHLGIITDTQDMTGQILSEQEVTVTEEEVLAALESFVGPYLQMPPMYSALKVDGKKLYELAREGKTVERAKRPVYFYAIEPLEIRLPLVRFRVTCSKGTYIRTLCQDIGEKLGCGGCMESLLRTRSGAFTLEDSVTLDEIEKAMRENRVKDFILGVEDVLVEFPRVCCTEEGNRLLANGNPLHEQLIVGPQVKDGWVRMCAHDGSFVGLYEWKEEKKVYQPVKMFYPNHEKNM